MFGISIYPEKQDQKDIIKYLDLASKYGFKRVFTCLLSANDTKENIEKDFKKVITHATSLGMEVVLDVAPSVFDKLKISYDDLYFFYDLGATGIRLDVGYDGQKEAQMTFNQYNLDIEINISQGTKYVDNILSYNPNKKKLIACHNFYPMEYSGLGYDFFVKTSNQYRNLGIRTAAFVNSHTAKVGPWPVMDGLCTVEMHRNLPISTQVKHLLMTDIVDDIIIGNAFASEKELKEIGSLSNLPVFDIIIDKQTTEIERKIILDENHFNRGDISDYLIRSTQSRVKYKENDFKSHNTKANIDKGVICIGNNDFKQYKGELHLTKLAHTDTQLRKNQVAKIVDHELFLLDYLKPWSLFKFKEVK